MDTDDPRTPLLGHAARSGEGVYAGACAALCSAGAWRRRLPITIWLPKYSFEFLLRDAIAGITVGLTSIPQGIAYAMVAGLPPQVGLYSSIFPGVVYALLGSCRDVTVGPTAILAALLAKYVAISPDFAYLAAFLSGCIIMLLGVLQLGFLLDFISKPVISGFTTAAALQISASQLKSLFSITGSSGGTFIGALINFFKNIKSVQLWDSLLGVASIIALLLLKRSGSGVGSGAWRHAVRARNALVVLAAALLACCLQLRGRTPFALTGTIEGGLPKFGPPPFSTTVNNKTLDFEGMLNVFGPEGLVMPLVAILESIAIAKAFSGGASVDATQEMVAVGAVNMVSAFCQSMPATGSFTRTALNHACGVATPAGSLFKASLVLLAVTLLSDAFYYIPRATLAGIIMVAMASIIEFTIVRTLWRNSKKELAVYCVTVAAGVTAGLEYGILCGGLLDGLRALAGGARPRARVGGERVGNLDFVTVTFCGVLNYAAASHVQRALSPGGGVLVLDGKHVDHIDLGVAESIVSVVRDLEEQGHSYLVWNFSDDQRRLFEDLHPPMARHFVSGPSIDIHILGLELTRC